MASVFLGLIYLIFFLSGAAGLIYELVWVRSLGLVFGGSHLAVTTVLSVYMAGLALGSYLLGKYVQHSKRPLLLYGLLEIGVGVSAVAFVLFIKIYPSIYIPLAQGKDHAPLYLSFIRVAFSLAALIVPTTLMGGTLPVLSSFLSKDSRDVGRHLSFLYGFNTLGAVAGTLVAGFYFLRFYSVSTTFGIALFVNLIVGVTSILLQKKAEVWLKGYRKAEGGRKSDPGWESPIEIGDFANPTLSLKLVLWGIGVSGFCALGYEVLWTRVLTIVVGASVYGFTTMLVAFLTGIALGSKAYGLYLRLFRKSKTTYRNSVAAFGIIQIVIGLTAWMVAYFIQDLPSISLRLRDTFRSLNLDFFAMQQWADLTLAFAYMVVPAFFMGLAFPLAGRVHAGYRKGIGSAVGEVLAYNTIGAILGAALTGYVMAYIFSIERSLQMLTVINIGFGVLILFSSKGNKPLLWGIGGAASAALIFLAVNSSFLQMWDIRFFALFQTNQSEIFRTPEAARSAFQNAEVLYYGEGLEAIVSSVKIKGGDQGFITNGRVEASTNLQDQQLQFTLGHLPMLLCKNPKNVLVVGLGSGMTVGATSVHPDVEKVVLVELEPKMVGVAKTFQRYNHNVLDHPKLAIVFNDGRNYLLTTREKFDVITADPIHPWFRGAGYLYTREYFTLASEHLTEDGIMCQWLPIYELTAENLKSVVKTFQQSFKYTMLWLTYYDSVIVGSNHAILIDEDVLDRRIKEFPAISGDLNQVMMGSATDLLSYFVMGSGGMRAFSKDGIVNTDDNLYLEFSAPLNIGKSFLMEENASALVRYREDIFPHLSKSSADSAKKNQTRSWSGRTEVTQVYDRAHALFLGGRYQTPEFRSLLSELDRKYPWYGPGRFLKNEYLLNIAAEPRLVKKILLVLLNERGEKIGIELSAVLTRMNKEMALVDIVDNKARVIYGHFDIPGADREEYIDSLIASMMTDLQTLYQRELYAAMTKRGGMPPSAEATLAKVRAAIQRKVRENESFSEHTP